MSLTTAEIDRVNATAMRILERGAVPAENFETLRGALRDIAFGAQMMQGVGDPKSAFNRYAAEVERVATAALEQVKA